MSPAPAIRACHPDDVDDIGDVINCAALAYAGVIPPDRYRTPYMARTELEHEMAGGVCFWGWFDAADGRCDARDSADEAGPRGDGSEALLGVMGMQQVDDATLIRHAYVLPAHQRKGIGKSLLAHLGTLARTSLYVGTWADAIWAVRFYERNGFTLVTPSEKDRLLHLYWSIPERQIETSVVLRLAETTQGAGS